MSAEEQTTTEVESLAPYEVYHDGWLDKEEEV